jgi:hypothetical protein
MKCAMDGYPVHGVKLVMGRYLPVVVERSCQLMLSPESNPPLRFGCHFSPADKETNWFERKHPAWHVTLNAICRNSLLGCMVADTIKLCLPAKCIEGCIVVLMCFNV